MSRSKRLVVVANAAPHSWDHLLGGRSSQAELIQPLVLLLLVLDVLADHRLVATDRRDEVPAGPEILPHEIALALPYTRARWIALLPLMKPMTCDTAYLGGMAIIMCT